MGGFTEQQVDRILELVRAWTETQPRIRAVALVGSWARGQARANSDLDLMFLTSNPELFLHNASWHHCLLWQEIGLEISDYYDLTYGVVWSRHLCFNSRQEIEFSFGALNWADTKPIDLGTYRVASSGLKIIYDPDRLLANLMTTMKRS